MSAFCAQDGGLSAPVQNYWVCPLRESRDSTTNYLLIKRITRAPESEAKVFEDSESDLKDFIKILSEKKYWTDKEKKNMTM